MINARVGHKREKVLIDLDGRVFEMPWEQAKRLIRALAEHTTKAEEYAQVNQIVTDGALMQRLGVPLGLTNNPAIQKEIYRKAQVDERLRKYVPTPGIRSEAVFGAPKIFQPITPAQIVAAMNAKERAAMRVILSREQ